MLFHITIHSTVAILRMEFWRI